jgi:cytochrome c553
VRLDLLLFVTLTLPLCPVVAGAVGAAVFEKVCASCHGGRGEGKTELKTPSIANAPRWYVMRQLMNFHEGRRGQDAANDPQGALMAGIAKSLKPGEMEAVAAFVENLPLVVPSEREIAGADVQRGQELFDERCMECHRYNASGEMAFGSPPLIGRQGWYLQEQLHKFKNLHRGAARGDDKGAKMVQMATQFIQDEQAMKNVVGYILTLNPVASKAEAGTAIFAPPVLKR